jgi:hypothetical protein
LFQDFTLIIPWGPLVPLDCLKVVLVSNWLPSKLDTGVCLFIPIRGHVRTRNKLLTLSFKVVERDNVWNQVFLLHKQKLLYVNQLQTLMFLIPLEVSILPSISHLIYSLSKSLICYYIFF